jgi:uncharacterized protein (DUF433 family)
MWAVAEKVGALDQDMDDPQFTHVTYRRGEAGFPQPVIRGTSIRVQTIVVASQRWGLSNEEIADDYELTLKQVEDALSFYEVHKLEIDKAIEIEGELEQKRG